MNTIEISINGQTVFEASCENNVIFDKLVDIILHEFSIKNDDIDVVIKRKFAIKSTELRPTL